MAEVAQISAKPDSGVQTDLAPFAPILPEKHKEAVLRAMCLVAWADGEANPDQRELIDQAGDTLGLRSQDVEQILQKASIPQTPPDVLRRQELEQCLQKAKNLASSTSSPARDVDSQYHQVEV